nr:nuclear transport factor 2 family protein [Mycobacterium avium]
MLHPRFQGQEPPGFPGRFNERRWPELAALFCPDGVLPWGGNTFRGRKEIIEGLPGTQPKIPHRIKHFVYVSMAK